MFSIKKTVFAENRGLLKDQDLKDETLTEKGKYWPYAQDGMYDEKTGHFDARN